MSAAMFDSQRLFDPPFQSQPFRPARPRIVLRGQAISEARSDSGGKAGTGVAGLFHRSFRGVSICLLTLLGGVAVAGQLTVKWDDNSTSESGFKIERSTNGSSFAQIAIVGANVTQYSDKSVLGSTTYAYRIRAYNKTATSAYSNLASVTTTAAGLAPSTTTSTTTQTTSTQTSTLTSTTQTTTTTTAIPSRLTRLAAKAVAEYGSAQSLVLNYTVTGASKWLLLRGVGPGLKPFTSATTLPDPVLKVYDGSSLIASNDNWGGTSALWSTFNRVGAFPLAGYSKDAALQRTFSVKSYAAIVNGNYRGFALADIFDADTATSPTGRLSKIFARATVGSGGEILVVGLDIKGDTNLRLVIRAIGPSLTGVSGVLQDPKLALYRGTSLLRTNDNWGGGSSLSSAFVKAGAYALPTSSKDSAIDITLAPGTYTATVSGVNDTKGVARLEVYEIR